MISLYIVLAVVISITLGYKTKINTGFFAISFAYIIGCFFLKLKAVAIIKMWPISIFFIIFAVSLFYNFAIVNGTLEKLALYILYYCRNVPEMLPLVIFLAATLIAGLGAGYFAVMAFFAPVTLMLCEKTGMNRMVGAIAVNYGALAGANFMTSASGIIFKSLMDAVGFSEKSFAYTTFIFVVTMIIPILVISGLILFFRRKNKIYKFSGMAKPEPFNGKQKTNMYLIVSMISIVLVAPILHLSIPGNSTITFINSQMDVGLISIVLSVVALVLKLADEKKVISLVPWNTLIMICGVGMLISVAIEAGTIKILANFISGNLPVFIVPITLCIIGGIMAFFSSTLGVVCPAIFPIIPSIAISTGLSPLLLFTCVVIGAESAALSPFSSGGSLMLGSCSTDKVRTEMFPVLLFRAVPICLAAATIMSIILFII